jgi:WD repeat-containing protein 23
MSWEPSDDDFDGGEPADWDARDRTMAQGEDEGRQNHEGDGEDDEDEDDPDYRDEPDEDDEFHGNSYNFHHALRGLKNSWLFVDY